MFKQFFKKELLAIFIVFVFVFLSTTNIARANFFTMEAASVWDSIINFFAPDPVVVPIPAVLPPPRVTLPPTFTTQPPVPPPPVNLTTLTTTKYVNTGLTTSQVQAMIDKALASYKPPASITKIIQGSSSSGLHVVGGGSSNNSNWKKNNSDLYFNRGNVAVGTSTLTGNAALQVKAQPDTLGSDQVANGNFSSQYGDEQITNGTFSNNADPWTLGNGWSYSGNSVVFDGIGEEEITNQNFTDMTDWEGGAWSASGNAANYLYVGAISINHDLLFLISGSCGYQVGDDLNVDAGDGNAVLHIDAVDGDGCLTDYTVTNPGTNYETGGYYDLIGGSGTGAQIYVNVDTLYQSGLLIQNDSYSVSFDITGTTGTVNVSLGDDGSSDTFEAGQGSVSFTGSWYTDYDTGEKVIFHPSPDFNGTITNVSVKHSSQGNLSQSGTLTQGIPYKVTLEVGGTEGSVNVGLGDDCGNSTIDAGAGVMTFTGTWCDTFNSRKLIFTPSSDFNGNVDNISVKPVLWQPADSGWTISGDKATHTAGDAEVPSMINDYALDSAGSGYQVNDVLTLDGGNQDFLITVAAVDGGGGITDWSATIPSGTGYSNSCYGTNGGHGSGAEFCVNSTTDPISATNTGALAQPGTLEDGARYAVSFHITGNAGTVSARLDDGDSQSFNAGGGDVTFTGTYRQDTNNFLYFTPSYDFNGSISKVSVKPATVNTAQEWFSGSGSELLNITSSGNNQGQINFNIPGSSNYVALRAPTWSDSNVVFTLPEEDGPSGYCLKTQGDGQLYFDTCGGGSFDQSLNTTDDATFISINTGQGSNQLYEMNQNVLTNSDVTFNSINVGSCTGCGGGSSFNQDLNTSNDVMFHNVTAPTIQATAELQVNDYNLANALNFQGSSGSEPTLIQVFSNVNPDASLDISALGAGTINLMSNVGIGTPSPTGTLDVEGGVAGYNGHGTDITLHAEDAGTAAGFPTNGGNIILMPGISYNFGDVFNGTGNVGIYCADPDHLLELGGTGTGCNTGTGSYINAGDLAFTANSSREWKTNIQDYTVDDILTKIDATPVRTYDWKPQFCSGDNCNDKLGFIAQEFYTVLQRGDGLHVNGQDISMAEWLGIQALYHKFVSLKTDLIAWFGDATNGIADFFANRVHTKEICVAKTDGTEFCANGDELEAAIGTGAPSGGSTPPPAPDPVPPTCIPPQTLVNNVCTDPAPDPVSGCTDATATNYNGNATVDDGSCIMPPPPPAEQTPPPDPVPPVDPAPQT